MLLGATTVTAPAAGHDVGVGGQLGDVEEGAPYADERAATFSGGGLGSPVQPPPHDALPFFFGSGGGALKPQASAPLLPLPPLVLPNTGAPTLLPGPSGYPGSPTLAPPHHQGAARKPMALPLLGGADVAPSPPAHLHGPLATAVALPLQQDHHHHHQLMGTPAGGHGTTLMAPGPPALSTGSSTASPPAPLAPHALAAPQLPGSFSPVQQRRLVLPEHVGQQPQPQGLAPWPGAASPSCGSSSDAWGAASPTGVARGGRPALGGAASLAALMGWPMGPGAAAAAPPPVVPRLPGTGEEAPAIGPPAAWGPPHATGTWPQPPPHLQSP